MWVPSPSGDPFEVVPIVLASEVIRTGSLDPLVDEARERSYRFLGSSPFLPLWKVRSLGAASVYHTLDLEWEALSWEREINPGGLSDTVLEDFIDVIRPLGESQGIVRVLGEWSGSETTWTDALGRVWEDFGLEV